MQGWSGLEAPNVIRGSIGLTGGASLCGAEHGIWLDVFTVVVVVAVVVGANRRAFIHVRIEPRLGLVFPAEM